MELYDSRYYSINKLFLSQVGLWPYLSYRRKLFQRVVISSLLIPTIISQVIRIYLILGVESVDLLVEHIAIFVYVFASYLKFLTTLLAEGKLKILYKNMADNWSLIKDNNERNILHYYSENGRKLTIGYIMSHAPGEENPFSTKRFKSVILYKLKRDPMYNLIQFRNKILCTYVFMNLTSSGFCLFPIIPIILDKINSLNVSTAGVFVFGGELFIDRDKYFIEIYIIDCICCATAMFVVTAADSMYAASIEHCLGLFALITARLHKISDRYVESSDASKNYNVDNDRTHDYIVQTIELHQKVIRFTDLLESSYSLTFFILMGLNVTILSCECVMVLIKTENFDELFEFFRFCLNVFGVMCHLFYLSWPGQKIINDSGRLSEDAYLNEWYNISLEDKQLLQFITLRCSKPCQLTAGGMYVMNFANLAMIIKTSMSYITLFVSIR